MFADDTTATAQQMPYGEGDVPAAVMIEPELSRKCGAGSWIRQESGATQGVEWRIQWFRRIGCLGFREMLRDFWKSLQT